MTEQATGKPSPKKRGAQELICPVIVSVTVIVLVLLNAPSIAYIVVAGACGVKTVQELRRS